MKPADQLQFFKLLHAMRENILTDEQFELLEHWLLNDSDAVQCYVYYVLMWSGLQKFQYALITDVQQSMSAMKELSDTEELFLSPAFWDALGAHEKISEPMLKTKPARHPVLPVVKQDVVQISPRVNKFLFTVFFSGLAAMLLLISYVHFNTSSTLQVATLSDAMNLNWSLDDKPSLGSRIPVQSEPIRISQGIARLMTDEGVELFIEAPTEFSFLNTGEVYMHYGRLTARLDNQSSTFVVTTPNCRIIDIGTEFGVQAHINGDTELHVFSGKIVLTPRHKRSRGEPVFLAAGRAMRVDYWDASLCEIPFNRRAFVSGFDTATQMVWRGETRLDLTDVICGGSGLGTGDRRKGLDIRKGELTPYIMPSGSPVGLMSFSGQRSTVLPITWHPFIDAVFEPDAALGPIVVSTAGHAFKDYSSSSGQSSWNLFAGYAHEFSTTETASERWIHAPSEPFGSAQPALMMHANLGVTFDLQAIRKALPEVDVRVFRATCGHMQTVPDFHDADGVRSVKEQIYGDPDHVARSDFFVLIDGHKRFEARDITSQDQWVPIAVPIGPDDRFLTLIVAAGSDDDPTFNWTMFIEPVLELSATPSTEGRVR